MFLRRRSRRKLALHQRTDQRHDSGSRRTAGPPPRGPPRSSSGGPWHWPWPGSIPGGSTCSSNWARISRFLGGGEVQAFLDTLCSHRRSEEHTSELQSPCNLVCRLLLEKKQK